MKRAYLILFLLGVSLFVFAACTNTLANAEDCCYYNQTLVLNDNYTMDCKETVGFFNYSDSILSEVCLHLYPNAFRQGATASVVGLSNYNKCFPNGKSYGEIKIESVSHIDSYLDYEICGEDENILKIQFNEDLYPNDTYEFEIGFSLILPNANHRFGYGENTINVCNYYPILCVYENGGYVMDLYDSNGDPFYSKIANYNVEIKYNKDLTLASTGVQSTVNDNDNKTTTIKANKVRDFAMVFSTKFTIKTETYDNVDILYYQYDDENVDKTMSVIKDVLEMNKKYGQYPYKTLSVVESNFVHGGMEYPNIVLISDDLADYNTYVNVVVHELCHQWWYGIVGNNQYKNGFLDEGLTDYNTALFYDTHSEYGITSDKIFNNATKSYAMFERVYNDVVPNFETSMIRPLNAFETENEYVYLSYVKGMLMFATLKEMMGTSKVDKCLRYYYECNKFSEAEPQDLVNAFESASGRNLQGFFDSWFNGKVVIKEL